MSCMSKAKLRDEEVELWLGHLIRSIQIGDKIFDTTKVEYSELEKLSKPQMIGLLATYDQFELANLIMDFVINGEEG